MLVKKYGNRRLYDTEASSYITLEELTDRVRAGAEVRVVDAKTGADLTQATLLQIVLETDAARLLPAPLLARLVRLEDDVLGEFFGQWVSQALDLYLSAKHNAQAVAPYFPLAQLPFTAGNAMARLLQGQAFWPEAAGYGPPRYAPQAPPPAPQPPPPPRSAPRAPAPAASPRGAEPETELAQMRQELEALKRAVAGQSAAPRPRARRKR
ncbi:MAG: polyhydroxyalkanoate synthesis regulator DNA-binding domain-containing protein [Polyangiaceae bacterium]|nr:polyhydroxyalkanoate synthesis regulator DNA-binding domain-containing protein [Polyangiaceae bacterium]